MWRGPDAVKRRLVALGGVVVAGAILSISLPEGGPIVLGVGLGMFVAGEPSLAAGMATGWSAVARATRASFTPLHKFAAPAEEPLISLALTARPLVLPLLAALGVGTFQMASPIQVVAGAAFVLIAWEVVIEPEKKSLELMLRQAHREADPRLRWLGKHAQWIAALILLAIPVWLATRSAVGYFKTIGGLATFLLVLALVMWLAALLLRLVGQASSYLRIALAGVLGGGLLRLGMALGLIPGDRAFEDAVPGLPVALISAALSLILLDAALREADALLLDRLHGRPHEALAAVVELSRKRWRGRSSVRLPPSLRRARHRLRQSSIEPLRIAREFGLTAALAATGVLLCSSVYGLAATAQAGASLSKPGFQAGNAAVPPPAHSDRVLADSYSPVLALTADERWSPIRVDPYLEHATLDNASSAVGLPSGLPSSCPRGQSAPCHRLTINCPTGHMTCAYSELGPHSSLRAHSSLVHVPLDGATYVRVLRRQRPPADGSPDPFVGWATADPGLAGLSILIQYWYFYYYDEWETAAFAGLLTQRHESDWEAVTVGLSDRRPLFVAYSEHCAGTWVRWPQVEVSNSPSVVGLTHPLVAVARGSHANYPEADQERSPDWTHCQGLPAGLTTLVSYASNIRDKTEYTWLWHQPRHGLILVGAKTQPMSFPGSWGKHDETMLDNFNTNQISANGPGPLAPPLQELWTHPLQKIFCKYAHPADYTANGCPTT